MSVIAKGARLWDGESAKTSAKPKLLFLARPFPPAQVTACTRTWNIAKYLSRLGWDVTVVTPHHSAWRQIDDPAAVAAKVKAERIKLIRADHSWRFLRPHSMNCANSGVGWLLNGLLRRLARAAKIDNDIGWIKGVSQACARLSKGDADVILATGSPFASFKLAKQLSSRLACPYVLDYRDPWTGNPHRLDPDHPSVVQEEGRLLADSAAVTVVSPSWADTLDRRFGIASKLHIVSNGYDPEELADTIPYHFDHFAIVYAGNFYPPKRVISPIMAVLKRLQEITNKRDQHWTFHYYGSQDRHVFKEAERLGVTSKVVSHGWVSKAEALSAVRGAGVVVVISSVDEAASEQDRGIMTGKVYEALGLKAPVLIIAPSGSDLEMIARGNSLVRSFTASEINKMAAFIADLISKLVPTNETDERLSWPAISRTLHIILQSIVNSSALPKASAKNLL